MSRPFRYTFILALVALATALAAVGGWRYARASAPVNGPIVLVSVDSLRADRLPLYGYLKARTPAIDALARDGVVFERAYAHTPLTLPAHATLLTGRLPFETGVRDNIGFVVKDDERLVSEILRDRGFETGAVVSSYLLRKDTGISQGFAFFNEDRPPVDPTDSESAITALRRPGLEAEAIAERWLATADTSRLFLLLHLSEPGAPVTPSAPGVTGLNSYDAQVAAVDEAIGRLVKYLKAHQLYDRSTIILVADHGEGLGDHGEQEHGLLVYEEALRVPLIIKQAAGEGAGRRVSDPVQHVDLVPTILDLAKAPGAGNLIGRSLKPLLDGSGSIETRSIYSESLYGLYHFGWSGLVSVTDGRYRYIRAPREELYDLRTDPAERENLIDRAPAGVLTRLRGDVDRILDGTQIPTPADVATDVRERLAAIGNVGMPNREPTVPLTDAKDKVGLVDGFRAAVRSGTLRQWSLAIDRLRTLLSGDPQRVDLWEALGTYAGRAARADQAVVAFNRILTLDPENASARLALANLLFAQRKFQESSEEAAIVVSTDFEASSSDRLAAHILLVEIALARRNGELARQGASRVKEADSRLPMLDYVEGRLLFDRGRFEDAIPRFEQAAAALAVDKGGPMANLDYYRGEALSRSKRYEDAENALVKAVESFPDDVRARAALAHVYRKTDRMADVAKTLSAMTRLSPTPETYRLVASLWTTFGDARQAAAVRAEGQRLLGTQSPSTRPAQ